MTTKTDRHESPRLLLVDDEEAARYGMRRALGGFDYQIAEADGAETARLAINEQPPDLLLLDVNCRARVVSICCAR